MKPQDKYDFTIKILTQRAQFEQWLRIFFYLDNRLNSEFDSVYESTYYIKLYELLTSGLDYANKTLNILKNVNNENLERWYEILVNGLLTLKGEISETELEFIRYKRHNACHIFQDSYEINVNKKVLIERTNRFKLKKHFHLLLDKHGTEDEFYKYLFSKLHPITIKIYKELQAINTL